MVNKIDLSQQKWSLSGWTPELWRMHQTMEIGADTIAEIRPMDCYIPCSVQKVLLDNNIIDDWNVGFNYKKCEWIENRHWIFSTTISSDKIKDGKKYILSCHGLDYKGEIYINTEYVGSFDNCYITYDFDVTKYLNKKENLVTIVFLCPPRFLGQFGFTSKITDFKPRFYYTWDWTCRIVQTGIWEKIYLYESDNAYVDYVNIETDVCENKGVLSLKGVLTDKINGSVTFDLNDNNNIIKTATVEVNNGEFELLWDNLDIDLWYPNGVGNTKLYELFITLLDKKANVLDEVSRKVGFRHIEWKKCEGAAEESEPWICSVNGYDIFIQGIDWTPIKQNFADVQEADYRKILNIYKEIGVNLLRVWGGAVLEREEFYNICDELGLMVWQEFPLSSSGIDNYPPEDKNFIEGMEKIAKNYVHKRGYHASLIIWCGGNELFKLEGTAREYPVDYNHPLIARIKKILDKENPNRRFIPGSPTGPIAHFGIDIIGKYKFENTHGPWKADSAEGWNELFEKEESMFKAEAGVPGASSLDILEKYAGELNAYPIVGENDYWSRPMNWWIETDVFKSEMGRYPNTKEEYVNWSQKRQAELLYKAVKSMKDKFPKCGGFIIWMGHDCYPCPANTSIIDFYGRLKPAGEAVKKVFSE